MSGNRHIAQLAHYTARKSLLESKLRNLREEYSINATKIIETNADKLDAWRTAYRAAKLAHRDPPSKPISIANPAHYPDQIALRKSSYAANIALLAQYASDMLALKSAYASASDSYSAQLEEERAGHREICDRITIKQHDANNAHVDALLGILDRQYALDDTVLSLTNSLALINDGIILEQSAHKTRRGAILAHLRNKTATHRANKTAKAGHDAEQAHFMGVRSNLQTAYANLIEKRDHYAGIYSANPGEYGDLQDILREYEIEMAAITRKLRRIDTILSASHGTTGAGGAGGAAAAIAKDMTPVGRDDTAFYMDLIAQRTSFLQEMSKCEIERGQLAGELSDIDAKYVANMGDLAAEYAAADARLAIMETRIMAQRTAGDKGYSGARELLEQNMTDIKRTNMEVEREIAGLMAQYETECYYEALNTDIERRIGEVDAALTTVNADIDKMNT
jgi:hypothetical protein